MRLSCWPAVLLLLTQALAAAGGLRALENCSSSSSLELPVRCYSQSSHCRLFGDCCQSAAAAEATAARSRLACVPFEPSKEDGVAPPARLTRCSRLHRPAALAIAGCPAEPSDADPSDIAECEKLRRDAAIEPSGLRQLNLSSLPVFGPDNVLYRSLHCLRCNRPRGSIDAGRFVTNVTVRCARRGRDVGNATFRTELMRLLLSGASLPHRCQLAFRMPERLVHRCYSGLLESAAAGRASSECRLGPTRYVLSESRCRVFRNQACVEDAAANSGVSGSRSMDSNCGGSAGGPSAFSDGSSIMSFQTRPSLLDSVFNFNLDPRLLRAGLSSAETSSSNSSSNITEIASSGGSSEGGFDWGDWATVCAQAASGLAALSLAGLYLSRRRLRNRSGLLLVSHALSLAAVSLLSLAETATAALSSGRVSGSPWTCLLALYCLDAGFAWAGLFGADLLRTLTRLLARPAAPQRRYGRFSALGWGLPALPAAAAAGLHFSGSPPLFGDKACSLPTSVAASNSTDFTAAAAGRTAAACRVGLVFAPWALALVFNAVCLLGVAVCLARAMGRAPRSSAGGRPKTLGRLQSRLQSSGRARRTLRRTAATAARVSAVLGIAWLPYCCLILAGAADPASGIYMAARLLTDLHGCVLLAAFARLRHLRRLAACLRGKDARTSGSSSGSSSKSSDRTASGARANAASGSA